MTDDVERPRENVFSYLDYQKFLRDWFEEAKSRNSFVSYRYVGNKVGLDASFLVKVFAGQLHISAKSIPRFAELLRLPKKESDYFELLVLFNKTRRPRESQLLFEKLTSMRSQRATVLDADKYEFFSHWYYIAVYEALRFCRFKGDIKELARTVQPAITARQARDALQLLERLQLIQRDSHDGYLVKDASLSTGETWISTAIQAYQKQTMELGVRALEEIPKAQRDISTVTVSLSKGTFGTIRARISDMRRELLEIARNDSDLDGVYQLNFQVFPLSKTSQREGA